MGRSGYISITKTKYKVSYTSNFKSQLKKVKKQGKDLDKLKSVISDLALGNKLSSKYKEHSLIDNKAFQNCRECHIGPDWLLVYINIWTII